MYRMMIADDEALEREGLEMMIRRTMPDQFDIVYAENGRIAIQKAEEFRPDIIFMDIRMPGIQGLEALREIRTLLPTVKMVLVTAYDYFAYAQEAVQLGVKDYILKPAKKEQIMQTLTKLIQEITEERKKRMETLEAKEKLSQLLPLIENELTLMLMDSIQGSVVEPFADLLEYRMIQGHALACRFSWDKKDSPSMIQEKKQLIYEEIRNQAKAKQSSLVSPIIGDRMGIFFVVEDKKHPYMQHVQAMEWGAQLQREIEESFQVSVAIGIGTMRKGWEGLRHSYQEAVLSTGDERESVAEVDKTDLELQENVIEKVKALIEERYQEDITMEQMAERVNLSPHYFSKVFKAQAGENFIDFLTQVRIHKAIELMKNSQLSLKEICYAVGYKDPNYFSRVFKKVVGLTPSEYRQEK